MRGKNKTQTQFNQSIADSKSLGLNDFSSLFSKRRNEWGQFTYCHLIIRAITSSPHTRMTLSQIYQWIVKNVAYFGEKNSPANASKWKNAIRHNLSFHKQYFVKTPNTSGIGTSWWTITDYVHQHCKVVGNEDEDAPLADAYDHVVAPDSIKPVLGEDGNADDIRSPPSNSSHVCPPYVVQESPHASTTTTAGEFQMEQGDSEAKDKQIELIKAYLKCNSSTNLCEQLKQDVFLSQQTPQTDDYIPELFQHMCDNHPDTVPDTHDQLGFVDNEDDVIC